MLDTCAKDIERQCRTLATAVPQPCLQPVHSPLPTPHFSRFSLRLPKGASGRLHLTGCPLAPPGTTTLTATYLATCDPFAGGPFRFNGAETCHRGCMQKLRRNRKGASISSFPIAAATESVKLWTVQKHFSLASAGESATIIHEAATLAWAARLDASLFWRCRLICRGAFG